MLNQYEIIHLISINNNWLRNYVKKNKDLK